MENIEISKEVLCDRNWFRDGQESNVYKIDDHSVYKIFKNRLKEKDVLENKLKKIIKLNQLGLEFLTTPTATLSYQHEFIGYKMDYDKNNVEWYKADMTLDTKIKSLKQVKDKLLILEQYGILFIDIKDSNILINQKTGELQFCDIDSFQVDDLESDLVLFVSRHLKEENHLFDSSIHAFMHNLYTLEQLEKIPHMYFYNDLSALRNMRTLGFFNQQQSPILENMALLKKEKIRNRYLIDNLR